MVKACPECDSTNLDVAPGGYSRPQTATDERWRCSECGTRFAEPVERDAHSSGGDSRWGLSKRLAEADPDEVGE